MNDFCNDGNIYELIVKTNFSIVYKFIDNNDGKPYILKVIPRNSKRKEADLCKKIPIHTNLIRFIEEKKFNKDIDDEYIFLIFEYFEGESLHKFAKEKRHKFTPTNIKIIFFQILNAVSTLHKSNIVHNDIKFENILIDPHTLHIKLIDFGLSHIGKEKKCSSVFGSLPYLAPEIISQKTYSIYSDVWALGILLFAMIEGKFPFYSNSQDKILEDISSNSVKGTVKKVYRSKYSIETSENIFNALVSTSKNRKNNTNYRYEMKLLMEVSVLCLRSTPENRLTVDEILSLSVFNNIMIM